MNPRVRTFLLAGASGCLYPLLFPSFNLGILAWVFLLPLHLALDEASPKQGFWLGWVAGIIAFIGTMYWVVTAMHVFGQVPLVMSVALMVLLATYLGLFFAGYALAVVWMRRHLPALAFVGSASVWVALELGRTYLFSGLPWCLLGYSQYRFLPIIQIADSVGVYGISFLIVMVNRVLSDSLVWIRRRTDQTASQPFPWQPGAIAGLCLVLTLSYGYGQLELGETLAGESHPQLLRVGLVQPNIDQAHKWSAAYREDTLSRFERLTRAVAPGADLVLWPEAATPFFFEREPAYQRQIRDLVSDSQTPLLLGSPALRFSENGKPYLLNRAYLLSKGGDIVGRYDKQHLVPFGEYIPLKSSVLFFLEKLVEGIGDFKSGAGPTILNLPVEGTSQEKSHAIPFGVVICYEVIFPNLVRHVVANGALFMTTITNDAWFGNSAAPHQHFGMVVLRAVENRVAFARSANTGVSGIIDPYGRIVEATPVFTQEGLQGQLPLRTTTTFYTEYGDVFAYVCVIISTFLLGRIFRHSRKAVRREG